MTLNGTYSANSIDEIVDTIYYLHKKISKHEKILSARQSYW